MKALDRFLSTLSFTSRIPIPLSFGFDPSRMDFNLPLVGIIPAILGGLLWYGGYRFLGGGIVTMILVLLIQYLSFNLFHLDGLMDTADAFLGKNSPEKRLAILKDSRIGVYGFFAGLTMLALKWGLLMELRSALPWYPVPILAYPISGRISAALIPAITPPQNETGLGALVKGISPVRLLAGGLLALGIWSGLVYGICLVAPARLVFGEMSPLVLLSVIPLFAPLVSLFMAWIYRRGIGGYTGDALGAAVELGELLHLGASWAVLRIFFYEPSL